MESEESDGLLPRAEEKKQSVMGLSLEMYNVLLISVAFTVLFTGFNAIQNYLTSLLPNNIGNYSLAVLYVSVVFACLLAPFIVARLHLKATLILGGLGYVVFMLSLKSLSPAIIYPASVVIGFGAAILWVAQGVLITRCSTEATRGRFAGIFWGIFDCCYVSGNLIAYFVFTTTSEDVLFVTMTVIGAAGVLMLFLLKPPPPPDANVDKSSLHDHVRGVGLVLVRKETLLLLPYFLLIGFEFSFWTGEFPQLLPSKSIGLVLLFGGVGGVLFGFVLSALGDKIGRSAVVAFASVAYAAGLVLSALVKTPPPSCPTLWDVPYPAYLAAFCFGVADSTYNSQSYAIVGHIFAANANAFVVLQIFVNVGSAAGYFYAPLLPYHGAAGSFAQVYITGGLVVVATALFVIVDQRTKKWGGAKDMQGLAADGPW